MYSAIPQRRLRQCLTDASASPLADAALAYPAWYRRRWHYLPEGYLSRRSATLYEALVPPLYNAGREHTAIAKTIDTAESLGPAAILELGCGPGHLLRSLARADPGATIAGVDLSPFMLELASGNLSAAATARVALRHADARHLPWGDATFDVVVAMHVLAHVPAPVARHMLDEAARVLKPGGALLIVDHRWHRPLHHRRFAMAQREPVPPGVVHVVRYQKIL